MRRREGIRVNGRPVIATAIDVSRGFLAHSEHAMAGIEGIREAPSIIGGRYASSRLC